jgi:hypothetical protein
MFSLLSATLWLGNVQYRTKTADSVEVVPSAALSTAAALLRVPEERLVFALSKRKITAGASGMRQLQHVIHAHDGTGICRRMHTPGSLHAPVQMCTAFRQVARLLTWTSRWRRPSTLATPWPSPSTLRFSGARDDVRQL